MNQSRFAEEFTIEAVRQIVERGHPVAEVSARLDGSTRSLYPWMKEQQLSPGQRQEQRSQTEELCRHKAELKRVTEEHHILKKGRLVLCQAVRVRYAFIERHEKAHGVRRPNLSVALDLFSCQVIGWSMGTRKQLCWNWLRSSVVLHSSH